MGRWVLRSCALIVLVAGVVGGVIWVGRWGLGQVRDQDRYLAALHDVECDVPEGMQKRDFLDEVQYHSQLPDRLNVLDDELPARLRKAFARHPWVDKVDNVTIAPPVQISV